MLVAETTGCLGMAVRWSNGILWRQILVSVVAAQSAPRAGTRGSTFGSNEAETRARGAAGVVGARQARFGDEVVDVIGAGAIERDESRDRRNGARRCQEA